MQRSINEQLKKLRRSSVYFYIGIGTVGCWINLASFILQPCSSIIHSIIQYTESTNLDGAVAVLAQHMVTFNQYITAVPKDGSGRLLFCWIQKVGCTSFKKLLSPHQTHIRKAGVPGGNPVQIWNNIFHNKSWHKALFYREPLERFLSGYLDKCIKEQKHGTYCVNVFGSRNATFDEAVRVLIHQDPNKLDGHFHSQVDFCGGLKHTLPSFDTVERLDPLTSRASVGNMLKKANITSIHFDTLYIHQKDQVPLVMRRGRRDQWKVVTIIRNMWGLL